MKLFKFSYAGFVLSIISSILFLSCVRAQKETTDATTAENTAGSESVSSQIENEEQFKVTVPDDLPEDTVLSFDVPEIPFREMKVISPLPDDVDEIKKTVKTAVRQEHILQEDENSKFEEWRDYDEQDRIVHWRFNSGDKWTLYTENGSRTYCKSSVTEWYDESDSKGRSLHYISKNQEIWHEYTDFDGYYTYFSWNSYQNGRGWGKVEGECRWSYRKDAETNPDTGVVTTEENWEFYKELPNRTLSSRHTIRNSINWHVDSWRVDEYKPENCNVTWTWGGPTDMSRGWQKRISRSYPTDRDRVNITCIYSSGEKNWTESGKAGNYRHRHYRSTAYEGIDERSISENGKEIISTSYRGDEKRFGITINDPETGKSYNVNVTPDDLYYTISRGDNPQQMYSAHYNNELNESCHYKRKSFDDEWVQVYPDPKNSKD